MRAYRARDGVATAVHGYLGVLSGLFVIASIGAWFTASAFMLEEAFGREMWGLGKSKVLKQMPSISTGAGEPGVIRGQAYVPRWEELVAKLARSGDPAGEGSRNVSK